MLFDLTLEYLFLLLLVGAFAGLIAGLLGVGGGLIIVPALIMVFERLGFSENYLTQMAIATSLATIIFTSMSSIRTHHRANLVLWPLVKTLSVGLFFGALLGALFASSLSGRVLQFAIGSFALLVAIQMFFQLKPEQGTLPSRFVQYVSGVVIAFVSAVFGIGGGSLSVPALVWFGLTMKHAVAVSAACGLPIAIFSVIGFIFSAWGRNDLPNGSIGFIYLPALIVITLTSTVMAHFGAKLAHRLPAKNLKKIFSLLLFVIGLKFIVTSF